MRFTIFASVFALIAASILPSCQREKADLSKLSRRVEQSPYFAIPLIDAKLHLRDILAAKPDTVDHYQEIAGGDSLIRIYHSIDSLYTLRMSDFLGEDPQIDEYIKSDPLGLIPRDGNFDDNFKESIKLDTVLIDYFSPAVREAYRTFQPSSPIGENSQTVFNKTPKPFRAPFQNIRSATFGLGTMTLTATNNYDVDIQFDLVLMGNDGGWSEIGRFEFDSRIAQSGGTGTRQLDMRGISLKNLRSQGFGYYLDNIVLGGKSTGSINAEKLLQLDFELEGCKLARGEVRLEPGQQLFGNDTTIYFDLSTYKNKQVREMRIREGKLYYTTESNFSRNVDFLMHFPTVTHNGELVSRRITARRNSISEGSMDLTGFLADLTSNPDTPYNKIKVNISYDFNAGNNWILFDSANQISNRFFNTDSVKMDWARGNFGFDTIIVDKEKIEYNLSEAFTYYHEGEIIFTNPSLNIHVSNGVGIAGEMQLALSGEGKNSRQMELFHGGRQNFNVKGPAFSQMGQNLDQTISLNRDNSKIVDFLAILPEKLEYEGLIYTNREHINNPAAIDNFVAYESATNVGVEAVVPLQFTMKDVVMRQHFATDIRASIGLDELEVAEVEELSLYMKVRNHFPLDLKIVYTLWDTVPEVDVMLDTLTVSILKAAKPDVTGKVGRYEFRDYKDEIVVSNKNGTNLLNNILDCNMIRADIILNTAEGGEKEVKFYTHYTLQLNMMVGTKIKYRLN
jgi:hypothetical protein